MLTCRRSKVKVRFSLKKIGSGVPRVHLVLPETKFLDTESTAKDEATQRTNDHIDSAAERAPWVKRHPTLTARLQIEILKAASCRGSLPGSALLAGSPAHRRRRTQGSASSLAPASTTAFLRP